MTDLNNLSYVYFGNNLDLMRKIPDCFFDFIIDDFVYGTKTHKMGYARTKLSKVKSSSGNNLTVKGGYIDFDRWDDVPPTQEYFDEVRRISKHQIMFGIDYVDWQGVGPGRIVWDKCVPEDVSFKGKETAYCSFIQDTVTIKLLWNGMQQAKSIAEPTVQLGDKRRNEKRIHNTQKPVLLYDILFRDYIPSGSKVLDPHLGSGSSRISARKANCFFVGCEKNGNIYSAQERRWELYNCQTALQLF